MLPSFPPQSAVVQRVNDYVAGRMEAAGYPGAAVVIVDDRGAIACRGFGVDADAVPVDCATRFSVASLTKSATAVALMQLVQAGRVRLDAPIRTYLPWFHTADPDANITVRNALLMRSGLDTRVGLRWLGSGENDAGVLDRRVLALGSVHLATAPGTAYAYSNANYDVIGAIVQRVSGTRFETYLQRRVFAPLGIRADFACTARPLGYSRWFSIPVRARPSAAFCADAPAGGLILSARAYGRYLAAHLDAGRTWSRVLLRPEAWAVLHHSPDGSPYAMGWMERYAAHGRVRQLDHDGAAPDFHSFAVLLPERRVGAAVIANANEMPDGGRSDAWDRGFARSLIGSESPEPLPRVPADLWLRLGVLAGMLAALANLVLPRRASQTRLLARAAIASASALLLWILVVPAMGTLAVGFMFAPDLTTMFVLTLGALALAALRALALAIFTASTHRSAPRERI